MHITPESLYTATDVKKLREKLSKEQGGVDPILKEPFKETQVMDHDHTTQHCRAVLNRNSNAFEGLTTNAYKRCLSWLTDKTLPEILRNLADYLEVDYSKNPYHPNWTKSVKTRFNKLKANQQDKLLVQLGSTAGKNLKERKELFAKVILDRNLGYEAIDKALKEV